MFNSRAFNERIFNYSPINYISATFDLSCEMECSPSVKAVTSASFDCTSDMSCETVRRRFTSAVFGFGCTVDVTARAYYSAFSKGIKLGTGEILTMPTRNNISPTEGTIQCIIYPAAVTEQFLFNANGAANKNLQLLIKSDGKLAARYGTGIDTKELVGETLQTSKPYKVAFGWGQGGAKLFLDGVLAASNTTPPDLSFGTIAYIGSSIGTKPFSGIIDDFCVTSYMKSDAEIAVDDSRIAPLAVTEETMYKLDFDDTLDPKVSYVWTSPPIDVSKATDKTTGHCTVTSEIPGGSFVITQSRSGPSAEGPWGDWINANANGDLQHDANNIIQIRIVFERNPSVSVITVSFDGSPTVEMLADNFEQEGDYYFATFMDHCIIANGLEAPRKYDGNTLSVIDGSPPHANYVAVHKNRLWMTKGSRLYFSNLLDIDSWPVLNFIDISPNDGDYITGIKQVSDYLVIAKQHSIWLLSGEGNSTFSVRRVHANKGAYSPRSLEMVNDTLCFISDDGVYFSDLVQTVLISERIKTYWDTLNSRRFNQVACWHFNHKLYISVPSANSIINDRVIVYDSLRKCFIGVIPDLKISCFSEFREGGRNINLFGHSNKGQVSQLEVGYSDNGVAIPFRWRSRELDFETPEILKRWNKIFMDIVPASTDVDLKLTFYVDGVAKGPITVTVPGDTTGVIHSIVALASRAGVVDGRRLTIQIEQSVLDNPVFIHGINIEYMIRGLRPSVYA